MVDWTLVGILTLGMLGNSVQAVLAPFFPGEAESKGVSGEMVGAIFSAQPFTACFCAPIFGMVVGRLGRRRCVIFSSFVLSISAFVFATLPHYDKDTFVVVGLTARIMQGFGGAGCGTSIMAIISTLYRDRLDMVIGIQQTTLGISMILGPMLGALLYMIGGFGFIFYTYTILFLVAVPIILFLVPADTPYVEPEAGVTWKDVFSVRTVIMNALVIIVCFSSLGALEPVLSSHLQTEFGVPTELIALAFVVPTVFYPVTVIVINKLPKRIERKALLLTALLIVGTAMVLIGPWSLLAIPPNLPLTIISLGMVGSGIAFGNIPPLPDMIQDAVAQLPHLPSDHISDRLSGLMTLSFFSGKTIGPPISGFFRDRIGFQDTQALLGGFIYTYAVIFGLFGGGFKALKTCTKQPQKPETLLGENEMVETKKSFYFLEEDEVL
eukprot:CAMPEP_0202437196 /NCGR_PEP_ID=MMETSP1345-20130828/28255_1 /ASSEMBLY_ACC=CAM_ASM_000843 /TAXON_ID=342563 /ORGANISM="Fabrea Fabrea salina" /LENGTH=437 /DNA_ID=CAMNT_0049050869 /DNA_START=567 /DNA_END=1880 /DNA_ORIENTATION=-